MFFLLLNWLLFVGVVAVYFSAFGHAGKNQWNEKTTKKKNVMKIEFFFAVVINYGNKSIGPLCVNIWRS